MRAIYRSLFVGSWCLLTIGVAGPTPLAAQAAPSAPVFQVTPYVGYMVFGRYLSGPAGTSLTNAPGVLYGAQAGVSLARDLSLIGNVGYTASDIKVGIPYLGGVSVGRSSMLIYDADLEYSLWAMGGESTPITPFVQAGVGAIRYDIDVSILNTQATNFAGNVGIGADWLLGPGVALRALVKDYMGKFNFQDAIGLDVSGATAHNFALSVGMRIDF